jgi:hypothetical protein
MFTVQLWIKQYADEPVNHLAKKIWEKHYTSTDMMKKESYRKTRLLLFCKYSIDPFGNLDEQTVQAFVDAISLDPSLLAEYIEGIKILIQSCYDEKTVNQQLRLFARIVERSAELVEPSQLSQLFEFLVYDGYLNEGPEVSSAFEKAGTNVCVQQGKIYSNQILTILTEYLAKPEHKRAGLEEKQKNLVLNESLILIASLAKYFDHSDSATLDIYERIVEMLNLPSKQLKKSISKCISPLSKLMEDKSK